MTSPDLSIPDIETEEEDIETQTASEADHTRMRMVQLAEAGEISQSVKYIKKASDKVISKLHAEYLMIEQDKNNTILSDVLITKFSELMGMLQTVPSGELLAAELREAFWRCRKSKSIDHKHIYILYVQYINERKI